MPRPAPTVFFFDPVLPRSAAREDGAPLLLAEPTSRRNQFNVLIKRVSVKN